VVSREKLTPTASFRHRNWETATSMDASRRRRRRGEAIERWPRGLRCSSSTLKANGADHLEELATEELVGEGSLLHQCADVPRRRVQPSSADYDCPGESDDFLDAALSVLHRMLMECEETLAGGEWARDAMLEETLAAFEHVTDICLQAGILPLDHDAEWPHDEKDQRQPINRTSSWCSGLDGASCCSDAHDGVRELPSAPAAEKGDRHRHGDDWDDNSSARSSQYDGDVDTLEYESDARQGMSRWEDRARLHLELDTLREQVTRSDSAVVDVKQQLDSTCGRLERLEVTMRETNKSVERTVQDQARHWRTICDELVQDKRSLATQLAEERGRFAALKRHLDTHSSDAQHQHTRPATPTSPASSEALASDSCASTHRSASLQSSPRRERERNADDDDRDPIDSKPRLAKDERLASFRRNYLSSSRGPR
jgi:hypothetical protein